MRALVFNKTLSFDPHYADPGEYLGDTVIQLRLAGICSTDIEITKGYMDFSGVLGHEFVGTVLSSPKIELIGQRVVGEINVVCGRCDLCTSGLSNHCRNRSVLGISGRPGCFSDLFRLPAENLHLVPDSVDDERAVFTEPLAAACQVLRQVTVSASSWVTVVGDGRLGLLVAQVLHQAGAPVRVVGRNEAKLALCERWGIRSRLAKDIVPKHDQDLVVDCTGSPEGLQLSLAMTRPRGTLVLKSTFAANAPLNLAPAVIDEITIQGSRCGPFTEALRLLESNAIQTAPLVQKRYRLNNAVEAMTQAQKKGTLKVLISRDP